MIVFNKNNRVNCEFVKIDRRQWWLSLCCRWRSRSVSISTSTGRCRPCSVRCCSAASRISPSRSHSSHRKPSSKRLSCLWFLLVSEILNCYLRNLLSRSFAFDLLFIKIFFFSWFVCELLFDFATWRRCIHSTHRLDDHWLFDLFSLWHSTQVFLVFLEIYIYTYIFLWI